MSNIDRAFSFRTNGYDLQGTGFVAHISASLETRDSLLKALACELNFPEYFGNNWDALEECLRDLSWIQAKRVVILHADLPRLEKCDVITYLDILYKCVNDWKPGEDHELVVVFPPEFQHEIATLLLERK